MRHRPDIENQQDSQSNERHEHGNPKRDLHPPDIETDKEHIRQQPPHRGKRLGRLKDRAQIAANANHNYRRGQYILNVFPKPGDKATPGSQG